MADFMNPRKRRRDDLICDITNITKRFKNLHLNIDSDRCNGIGTNNIYSKLRKYAESIDAEKSTMADDDGYQPELGIELNPFYYEKNKLLYQLHVERVRRGYQ